MESFRCWLLLPFGEILINILWQYAKLFKKYSARRMRQEVEAFKVINIGRKGSEKMGEKHGVE